MVRTPCTNQTISNSGNWCKLTKQPCLSVYLLIVRATEFLRSQAQFQPEKTAFIFEGTTITYGKLWLDVERLATGLYLSGIRAGDRIALHLRNTPDFITTYFACFRLGAIAAPLNIRLKAAELCDMLSRLRPALYIGQEDLFQRLGNVDSSILANNRRFLTGRNYGSFHAQPWTSLFLDDSTGLPPDILDPQKPVLLLATSGTTGVPKFVAHTQTTLAAMAEFYYECLLLDQEDLALETLPLAHVSGTGTMLTLFCNGVPFVLVEQFGPTTVLDRIESYGCTWFCGLPSMYFGLLEEQQLSPRNVRSLRKCITGGDVCPTALRARFLQAFGTPIRPLWASTEASGNFVGAGIPGIRIRRPDEVEVVDLDDVPVAEGEVGRLIIRASNVSIGYWLGPDQIDDRRKDGWFYTGDLVQRVSRNEILFNSRQADIIKRASSKVSPVEVEKVLLTVPNIKDAAVFGLPDDVLGQRVGALVQLDAESEPISPEQILASIEDSLADYKLPEQIFLVDRIPRNALGKIDRPALLAFSREVDGVRSEKSCRARVQRQ
jgi:long-chain acyl-CoA synthetase